MSRLSAHLVGHLGHNIPVSYRIRWPHNSCHLHCKYSTTVREDDGITVAVAFHDGPHRRKLAIPRGDIQLALVHFQRPPPLESLSGWRLPYFPLVAPSARTIAVGAVLVEVYPGRVQIMVSCCRRKVRRRWTEQVVQIPPAWTGRAMEKNTAVMINAMILSWLPPLSKGPLIYY